MQGQANGREPSNTAPDYIAHWVVKTSRAEEMVRWYGIVFGARVAHRSKNVTFLTWDGESHRLALVSLPKAVRLLFPLAKWRRKLYGVDHLAFGFRTLEQLLNTYARLRSQGVVPVWSINHGPTTSLYYEDPDGTRLEFQSDNFDSPQQTSDFFSSQSFAENPIGVNVDPDYLLEQLRAGVSVETLRRSEAGRRPGTPAVANFKAINWRTL
jgi:catechol 2,3-dioxygenase-like lactoylglutathione lyase family enzyme